MWVGRLRYVAATGAALGVILAWIVGLAFPSDLVGAAAWSVAVFAVLFGLGAGVSRAFKIELDVPESMLVGTVVWVGITGVLIAIGVCSRWPMLCLAGLASLYAIYELAQRPWTRPTDRTAIALGAVLAVLLGIQLLGMVTTRGNPYDDQIGYTAFVRRLLDCGNLIEPFSLRRLSAYGGQTSLLSLAALRGDVESTDLLDRGIFQVIAVVLTISLARRRKLHLTATVVVVAFLICVWDMSINSAGTWTGFTCFLGAYGFATREDLPPRKALGLAFAVCGCACTIRQNYLVPAGLFAALLLVFHLRAEAVASSWRRAWTAERRTVLVSIGIAAAVVLPYMVAAWRSNHTFLYPVIPGTGNPVAPLRPMAGTWADELSFMLSVALVSEPIRVWWIVLPFMLAARDSRRLRVWPAMLTACAIGFVVLIHSFLLSDPATLWRYAFGYMTPLAIVFLVELGTRLPMMPEPAQPPPLRLGATPAFFVWLVIVMQFVVARGVIADRISASAQNLKAAIAYGTDKTGDTQIYYDLQKAVPPGTSFAVMLDDPYLLDYSRNEIFNLDIPGFAAPAPGWPSFLGPERLRTYFLGLGIRYVAFVDGTHSAYMYRRGGWVYRMFSEGELWRFIGAHMLDAGDTLAELKTTSTVLFDREGVVVLDLGTHAAAPPTTPDPPELERQDAFVKKISETELHNAAWMLSSRRNVVFQPDGLGPTSLRIDPMRQPQKGVTPEPQGVWSVLFGPSTQTAPPFRYIADRTHVRLYGEGRRQHLHVKVWTYIQRLAMIDTLTVTLDGNRVARASADADGYLVVDSDVSCSGWCDLYLVMSSVSEYWKSPDELQAVKLLELTWDELP